MQFVVMCYHHHRKLVHPGKHTLRQGFASMWKRDGVERKAHPSAFAASASVDPTGSSKLIQSFQYLLSWERGQDL